MTAPEIVPGLHIPDATFLEALNLGQRLGHEGVHVIVQGEYKGEPFYCILAVGDAAGALKDNFQTISVRDPRSPDSSA